MTVLLSNYKASAGTKFNAIYFHFCTEPPIFSYCLYLWVSFLIEVKIMVQYLNKKLDLY